MIQNVPFETPDASPYSADELRRFDADTRTQLSLAMNALAARTVERLRAHAANGAPDNAGLLARLKQDLRSAVAELDDGQVLRVSCELLRLYRVCGAAACRRSRSCVAGGRCARSIEVPAPVLDRVAWMLLAERVPWISSRADEELAYDCWIAGFEAGASGRAGPEAKAARAGSD